MPMTKARRRDANTARWL